MILEPCETPGITPAAEGIGGIVWNVLGQSYVPKQVTTESFAWSAGCVICPTATRTREPRNSWAALA